MNKAQDTPEDQEGVPFTIDWDLVAEKRRKNQETLRRARAAVNRLSEIVARMPASP